MGEVREWAVYLVRLQERRGTRLEVKVRLPSQEHTLVCEGSSSGLPPGLLEGKPVRGQPCRGEQAEAGCWAWKVPERTCREQTVRRRRSVAKTLQHVEGNRESRLMRVGGGRVHAASAPHLGDRGAAGRARGTRGEA